MTPDRSRRIEELYQAAMQHPAHGRAAFLGHACAGDEALRRDIESLLAQRASGDDALARGAIVAAARFMIDVERLSLTGQRIGVYQAR